MDLMRFAIVFIGVGVVTWLVSFLVESLRVVPRPPEVLRWAPDIGIRYLDVDDRRLRYIKCGSGPETLVLLHTLRTQLDLFEKIIPALSKRFTVCAFDYPGHGYSEITDDPYDADFFIHCVEQFIEAAELSKVTLVGVSIGGAIALGIAGRKSQDVERVIAINPYDYAAGRGMGRSSLLGKMISVSSTIPVVGETVMRLRNFLIMRAVLNGGVADPNNVPTELMREMYVVGNRRGHYSAFLNLLRNAQSWEQATVGYRNITVPVLLVWGSEDWSTRTEREHDRSLIPNVVEVTIPGGGHFLPLDKPAEVVEQIDAFVI